MIFSPIISDIYDSFLSLAYPRACEICGDSAEKRADGIACANCWRETRIFNGNETLCSKCGAFLIDKKIDFQTFCRRCDAHFYNKASAVGLYEKALLVSILRLKTTPSLPSRLSDLLTAAFYASDFQDSTLIIPVPLSEKRLRERGFNQAEIIAANLARKVGANLDKTSLRRKIHTEKSRRGMDRKSREESVKNVFEVAAPRLILGQKILLVDDVFTSGATVSNCGKALKKAGAEKVCVLTLARAK